MARRARAVSIIARAVLIDLMLRDDWQNVASVPHGLRGRRGCIGMAYDEVAGIEWVGKYKNGVGTTHVHLTN